MVRKTLNIYINAIVYLDNSGLVNNENKQPLLLDEHREVRIEGPLGAPAEHYNNYEHVIFVAGGVGATPFSSILIGLLYQLKRGENLKHKSVTFYWIQREYEKTDFLSNILEQLAVENKNGIFEINIFITCGQQRFDFR